MSTKSDTKLRIIDATWKLFNDMSPKSPTLGEVAKEAGVSRQAVYLHFGNRSNLLTESIQIMREKTGSAERLKSAREVEPELVLSSWVDTLFGVYEMNLSIGKTYLAAAHVDEAGRQGRGAFVASVRRSAAFVIERFDSLGMLQPKWTIETATDWLYTKIDFAVWHLIVHELGWSREQAVLRTVESLESDLLVIAKTD
jgi:AcrR family transcriptional regulator